MIAKDYQEVYECGILMVKYLDGLGVPELTTFGNVTQPAGAFAEQILLECNRDRVEKLTREQPEQARAFLSILRDVLAELTVVAVSPGAETIEDAKVNMVSAEAVLYAVKARRARGTGQASGRYLTFPKD
ncbi:MAG: hypothetical protein ACLQDC_12990 [Verrucomicrobiia bacterium]